MTLDDYFMWASATAMTLVILLLVCFLVAGLVCALKGDK